MIRIEVIANHSVEENILEALAAYGVGKYYTKYPSVFGVGSSGPRMGDAIWPEENFALVVWCGEEDARLIEQAVAGVKEKFPGEGIKIFGLPEDAPGEAAPLERSAPGERFAPAEPPALAGAPRPALVDAIQAAAPPPQEPLRPEAPAPVEQPAPPPPEAPVQAEQPARRPARL